ncbi:hypothetical protein BC332_04144 [Capsicum chinense]|nr:hypothetical protein BC332_04144 [Capsicum chinense]
MMEAINDGKDLHVSITMPCIEVDIIGGENQLASQLVCLNLLGVKGRDAGRDREVIEEVEINGTTIEDAKTVKVFGIFVELEDDSEELVCSIVVKMRVEHMVMHYILDMEVVEHSIMDFGSDYVELWHEIGLELESDDNVVFLTVFAVQLQ